MIRILAVTLAALALSIGCTGCGRLIREGAGAARGASGKVVSADSVADLTSYNNIRIEPIGIAQDLQVPSEMPSMIRMDMLAAAESRGLLGDGGPALKLSGEIVHYETAGTVDTAIGPLEEVIVRTTLVDAQTGKVLAQANLIGRAKATMSSGPRNLSGGVAKALSSLLKAGGLRNKGGENNGE